MSRGAGRKEGCGDNGTGGGSLTGDIHPTQGVVLATGSQCSMEQGALWIEGVELQPLPEA